MSADGLTAGSLTAETSSGDVLLERSQGEDLRVTTVSGDVELCLFGAAGDYAVSTATASGRVSVPSGAAGGEKRVEITTNSGDIDVSITE